MQTITHGPLNLQLASTWNERLINDQLLALNEDDETMHEHLAGGEGALGVPTSKGYLLLLGPALVAEAAPFRRAALTLPDDGNYLPLLSRNQDATALSEFGSALLGSFEESGLPFKECAELPLFIEPNAARDSIKGGGAAGCTWLVKFPEDVVGRREEEEVLLALSRRGRTGAAWLGLTREAKRKVLLEDPPALVALRWLPESPSPRLQQAAVYLTEGSKDEAELSVPLPPSLANTDFWIPDGSGGGSYQLVDWSHSMLDFELRNYDMDVYNQNDRYLFFLGSTAGMSPGTAPPCMVLARVLKTAVFAVTLPFDAASKRFPFDNFERSLQFWGNRPQLVSQDTQGFFTFTEGEFQLTRRRDANTGIGPADPGSNEASALLPFVTLPKSEGGRCNGGTVSVGAPRIFWRRRRTIATNPPPEAFLLLPCARDDGDIYLLTCTLNLNPRLNFLFNTGELKDTSECLLNVNPRELEIRNNCDPDTLMVHTPQVHVTPGLDRIVLTFSATPMCTGKQIFPDFFNLPSALISYGQIYRPGAGRLCFPFACAVTVMNLTPQSENTNENTNENTSEHTSENTSETICETNINLRKRLLPCWCCRRRLTNVF